MTRRRWIADEVSGNRAALLGPHAHHLAVVLRARVGQQFDIAAGDVLRSGRVTSVTPERVEFELREAIAASAFPQITLLLAIYKFDRLEWAIEKCTELGVSRIVPLIARRSGAHLVKAAAKRSERWQRIAHQAAEQSRRISSPSVDKPVKFMDAINLQAATRILLAESERNVMLRDALQGHSPEGDLILALGPEGGWVDDEVTAFKAARWTPASLGDSILRAETAAIAATAVAAAELW